MGFSRRSYFNRAWVVQEAIFARRLVFLCGEYHVPTDQLLGVSKMLVLSGWSPQILGPYVPQFQKKSGGPQVGSISAVLQMMEDLEHQKIRPLEILSSMRSREAGMPVDKVYSLLNLVWFAYAEAQMDPEDHEAFVKGYKSDKKYAHIMEEIRRTPSSENTGALFRAGYPFAVVDGLLYNIAADGTRTLCVPYAMVKKVLESAHNEKHHFGRDRMLYDLRGLSIHNKTYAVKKYIKFCPSCIACSTDHTALNDET